MCINNIVIWCNQNEGFLSAILASASLVVSGVALYISVHMERKQYKNALYEKKLAVLKKIDELMRFIMYLELYERRLLSDNIEQKNRAINMIYPCEINLDWIYEFRQVKFVVGKFKCSNIDNISKWVHDLLINYKIFKDDVKGKTINNDDIAHVFANIQNIKDAVQSLRKKIEKDLYL